MIKKHSTDYYDWINEVGPEILKNLNEILAAKGIDPLRDLSGGMFKDGKWVGIMDGSDYRNYWHAYTAMWGDDLRNDSYQTMYFPHPDDDEDWDFYIKKLRQESAAVAAVFTLILIGPMI